MTDILVELAAVVTTHNGINDKSKLRDVLVKKYGLTRDRSVFYCENFAIRFSSAPSLNFSNTVLSLSKDQTGTAWLVGRKISDRAGRWEGRRRDWPRCGP